MSTLDQMQAFVAVVEEGSFTAAALKFDVSTTAMSKKIATLERALNTKLLIRTPRVLTLTDIGKKYYAQCKKVLHEYKLSRWLIEEKNSHLNGTLNIVCIREVAQSLVYPSMAMFLEHYPHMMTNVTIKKNTSDFNLKNFDIAIGYVSSEFFDDWCSRKIEKLVIHYPNIKPIPIKISVYMEYLDKSLRELNT